MRFPLIILAFLFIALPSFSSSFHQNTAAAASSSRASVVTMSTSDDIFPDKEKFQQDIKDYFQSPRFSDHKKVLVIGRGKILPGARPIGGEGYEPSYPIEGLREEEYENHSYLVGTKNGANYLLYMIDLGPSASSTIPYGAHYGGDIYKILLADALPSNMFDLVIFEHVPHPRSDRLSTVTYPLESYGFTDRKAFVQMIQTKVFSSLKDNGVFEWDASYPVGGDPLTFLGTYRNAVGFAAGEAFELYKSWDIIGSFGSEYDSRNHKAEVEYTLVWHHEKGQSGNGHYTLISKDGRVLQERIPDEPEKQMYEDELLYEDESWPYETSNHSLYKALERHGLLRIDNADFSGPKGKRLGQLNHLTIKGIK